MTDYRIHGLKKAIVAAGAAVGYVLLAVGLTVLKWVLIAAAVLWTLQQFGVLPL